jgi:ribosomal-protein-alanine N-acetyltransferase
MKVDIRPLIKVDSVPLQQLFDNENISKRLRDGVPVPYKKSDAIAFVEKMSSVKPSTVFAVTNDDEFCGIISLTLQSNIHRKNAELGYWIGEPFWGKGIAKEAVKLICSYGLSNLSIVRIFAGVFDNNIASRKVLEHNNFVKDCVIKDGVVKNGLLMDEHCYSIYKGKN